MKARKWADAAVLLQALRRREPEQTGLAIELADALVHSGRREDALSVLSDAAAREHGPRREALMRRTRVLSRLFLSNTNFQIYQDGLNLAGQGKYRAAKERFEHSLAEEPANAEVLLRVGQCQVLDGDFDSAAERLKLARKLNPFEPEIHLWLGRALQQRGEIDEALEELKSASLSLAGSEIAPVWYAEALFTAGQRGAAYEALEDDLERRPLHLESLLALAELRLDAAADDEAARRSSQAATSGGAAPPPDSAKVRARAHESAIEARKDLQLALSRLPQYDGDAVAPAPMEEAELGLSKRPAVDELKVRIDTLLKRVETRLDELSETDS